MKKSCKNCNFFHIDKIDKGLMTDFELECRRYAPRCGEGRSKFPNVEFRDWCGEFQINPEPHLHMDRTAFCKSAYKICKTYSTGLVCSGCGDWIKPLPTTKSSQHRGRCG